MFLIVYLLLALFFCSCWFQSRKQRGLRGQRSLLLAIIKLPWRTPNEANTVRDQSADVFRSFRTRPDYSENSRNTSQSVLLFTALSKPATANPIGRNVTRNLIVIVNFGCNTFPRHDIDSSLYSFQRIRKENKDVGLQSHCAGFHLVGGDVAVVGVVVQEPGLPDPFDALRDVAATVAKSRPAAIDADAHRRLQSADDRRHLPHHHTDVQLHDVVRHDSRCRNSLPSA